MSTSAPNITQVCEECLRLCNQLQVSDLDIPYPSPNQGARASLPVWPRFAAEQLATKHQSSGDTVTTASAKDQRAANLFVRIWRRWGRRHLRMLLLNFLFIAIFSAVNGLYAPLIKYIVDGAAAGRTNMEWILLAALAVTLIKAGALLVHKRLNVRLFTQVSVDMQRSLYGKMIHADIAWHGREAPAALGQRVMADVEVVRTALERVVNNLIRDVLMVVAVVASMIYIDWQLSLIALLIFPIAIWPIAQISKILRKIGRDTQASIGQVSARVLEGLAGIQIAKTYQLEGRLKARSGKDFDDLRRLQVRAGDHTALIDPMMEALGGIVVIGVLFFVGWRLEAGQNSLGDFAGFITALLLAGQPLRALGNLAAHVQRGLAGAQRIFDVLDEEPKVVDAEGAVPLVVSRGQIELKGCGFGYSDGTRALDDVSLIVPANQRLALVGRSGAGKSTLFNLVPRLFDPTDGQILIDDQDLTSVTIASLREQIALVTQDAILFNDTVRANIALGQIGAEKSLDNDRIVEAAKAAAAHDFILALPEGYDTIVGDRGSRLSGGQRQRLSIARAIFRDAPIVLLDEATSALDAEAEAQVKEAFDRLSDGRTTIVIAHRLSTIMDADVIAVLDGGRLVETGNHDELIAKDGIYASLFRLQFKDVTAAG